LRNLPPRSVILAEDETDLRLFPPLRSSWSPRGRPAEVVLCGANAKRVLCGCLNIRTGHRLRLVRKRQRSEDFRELLDLVHQSYRSWPTVLLLDEDRSHTAGKSQAWAAKRRIRLEWLPKRSPHLNPMDHLWRHAKGVALANRQEASIDDLVNHALHYLDSLSPREALRKAGLLAPDCWLKNLL
jgi:transposase